MRNGYSLFIATTLFACAATAAADDGHDPDSAIQIDCRAENEFGYIATAHGSLQITSRPQPSLLAVRGMLDIDTKLYGEQGNPRSINVQGSLELHGSYASLDVLSGADDLLSVLVSLAPNGMSYLEAKDSTQYQMKCSQSVVNVPKIADLVLLNTLRYAPLDGGGQRVQIDVRNVGNAPVPGPASRVRIVQFDLTGTLYAGGAPADRLEAGQQGYIEADIPTTILSRCSGYRVVLDLDRRQQSGPFDPFANDGAQVESQCLRWNTPIDDYALGAPVDSILKNKSLQSIVSSEVVGRSDGDLCSKCHYRDSSHEFSPPLGRTITSTDIIGTYSWAESSGLADRFLGIAIKPENLKQAIRRWQADGAR